AFGFLLKVHAAQVQRTNAGRNFRIGLARQPAKCLCRFALREQLAWVLLRDSGHERNGAARLRHFGWNRKHRIHVDGHCQLATLPVINDAAARRDFFGTLLLMLCPLLEAAVAKTVQMHQARADGAAPKNEYSREQIQPDVRAVAGCGGHSSSEKYGGRLAASLKTQLKLPFRAKSNHVGRVPSPAHPDAV